MTEQPDTAAIRANMTDGWLYSNADVRVLCDALDAARNELAEAQDSARDERDQAELRGCRWHHIRSKAAEMLAEERLDRALAAEALLHAEQDNWAAANVRANAAEARIAAALDHARLRPGGDWSAQRRALTEGAGQ